MPRINDLRPQLVELMPDDIEDGILYISEKYSIALHNCCCGCGEEVSTPLSATEYQLIRDGVAVSLFPSIGNHDFPCRSHYWIERNKVRWSYAMSREQIESGREHDRRLKRGHPPTVGLLSEFRGWLQRLFLKFRR
jgi:hypothetical protein